MPPKWQALTLGEFTGGINTASDPASLEENELVDCVNLHLDMDGSLIARTPVVSVTPPGGVNVQIRAIGNCLLNGVPYVIFATNSQVWAYDGSSYISIVSGIFASSVTQYNNKVYIVTYSGDGGYWNGSTWTSLPSMPKGAACTIWKERMWIVSGGTNSRLSFSNIANPDVWSGSDFFNISAGDGQQLLDLAVFNNNLLLFKKDSAYVLSYDTKISESVLTKFSNNIGVSGYRCIAQKENQIYVYHEGEVYLLVNYEFIQINPKVDFLLDLAVPVSQTQVNRVFLGIIGDLLIVRYFSRIYTYHTINQAWSRWDFQHLLPGLAHWFGYIVELPRNPESDDDRIYYMGSSLNNSSWIYRIKDNHNDTDLESGMPLSIRTRNYDLGVSWKFKRLWFWGADVMTLREVTSSATPVVYEFDPSWGDLASVQLQNLNTYDQPITFSASVTTNVAAAPGPYKRFLKFNKGLRFRQIYFNLNLVTDGSFSDGPARIYTLTAFAGIRETVSRQVS